jgi:arylsulfatase A-like enzyme
MYGIDQKETQDFGTRCLIARRLVERGVRFVSVFTGNQTWDNHTSILTSLPAACRYVDKPAAALVTDLKQRGLLDSTVVHWGGEMGRLPVIQNRAGAERGNRAKVGRDHNTYGFSMWMAGGGFKGGYTHGETDEFGHKAVKDVVNHYDYHATLLHLFGLNPEELTFKRNGQEQSLILNPEAKVVEELLA